MSRIEEGDGHFSQSETDYLRGQRLGRIATVGKGGGPHVVPVAFTLDAGTGTVEIGGTAFGRSKKFRDLRANPKVAFVVDDLASTDPWTPRGIEIRGVAEVFEQGGDRFGDGWDAAWIRIKPKRIVAWGIDAPPFEQPDARSV